MNDLLRHIWLLMTFRHDGAGLRVDGVVTIVALIALSCLFAWARWGIGTAIGHALVLFVAFSLFDRRGIAGCALLSAGIDTAAMLGSVAGIQNGSVGWLAWELSAAVVLGIRLMVADRAPN